MWWRGDPDRLTVTLSPFSSGIVPEGATVPDEVDTVSAWTGVWNAPDVGSPFTNWIGRLPIPAQ